MSRPPITRWDGVLFQRQLDAALDYVESLGGGGVSGIADVPGLQAALDAKADDADLSAKQDALVSGTNIKTVNGNTLLGSGDIVVSGGGASPAISWVI